MARRCEVLVDGRAWRAWAFAELQIGMVFRLFESDGMPVKDKDDVWRWRALGPPSTHQDGTPRIDAEPVPETEAERAVRQQGMYWPDTSSSNRFR